MEIVEVIRNGKVIRMFDFVYQALMSCKGV